MRNYWETLGIEPTNNKRIVKKAYAKKVKEFHPEEFPDDFQKIQKAYEVIMEALSRDYQQETYDSELRDLFSSPMTYDNELEEHIHVEDINNTYVNLKEHDISLFDEIIASSHLNKNTSNNEQIEDGLLKDYFYQKIQETIKYHNNIWTLKPLIMNKQFYDLMGDFDYYKIVCCLLLDNVYSFDTVELSFLFDAFSIIMQDYKYKDRKTSVPAKIKTLFRKPNTYKENLMVMTWIAIGTLVILFVFYIAVTVFDL